MKIDANTIYLNSFYVALIPNLPQISRNKYHDFYNLVHFSLCNFVKSTRLLTKKTHGQLELNLTKKRLSIPVRFLYWELGKIENASRIFYFVIGTRIEMRRDSIRDEIQDETKFETRRGSNRNWIRDETRFKTRRDSI